jgi:hypothetical protein
MNPQEKRRARVARAAAARTLRRYRAIKNTIPRDWPEDVQAACRRYVQNVLALGIGKNRLARVVWPWESRPESPRANPAVKVLRGRPR